MSNTRTSVSSPPGTAGDSVEDLISDFEDLGHIVHQQDGADIDKLVAEFEDIRTTEPDESFMYESTPSAAAAAADISAVSVKQQSQPQPHVLRIVWDADGCAYNSTYRKSLFFFMHEYADRIVAARANKDESAIKQYSSELLNELHEKFQSGEYRYKSDTEFNAVYAALHLRGMECLIAKLKELGLSEWCETVIREKPRDSLEWETVAMRVSEMQSGEAATYFSCLRNSQCVNWIMQQYLVEINAFNDTYHQYIFACSNVDLAERFLADKDRYDEVVLMVGSNRQSYDDDQYCKWVNSTGSIFNDLHNYVRVLQGVFAGKTVKMDKTTMADIQNRLLPEESFNRILSNSGGHAKYQWDEKKGTMLYAFCHRAAVEHPDSKVTVKFIDDREDIIHGLEALFTRHYDDNLKGSDLLPKGLTLNLIRYDGGVRYQAAIEGTGEIDSDYMCSSMIMSALSEPTSPDGSRVIIDSVHSFSNPEKVKQFIQRREAEKQRVMSMSLMLGGSSSFFARRKEMSVEQQSQSYTFGAAIK